jgi:hypothetical protein
MVSGSPLPIDRSKEPHGDGQPLCDESLANHGGR